ncbi:MAG: hypothetical protein BGO90_03155 [Legionella sp. 40-6]|nr:MAG: hypothetical protein BGO90_03155 [Legionella sp. 40-6]
MRIVPFIFRVCLYLSIIGLQGALASPPGIGNFSLKSSQQPGPFFSFGQNIIDRDQFIVSTNPTYTYSKSQSITEETPSFLYGVADTASFLLTIPIALSYQNENKTISGIGDLVIDLEYAFYNHDNKKYSDQATIIFSPTLPTGNLNGVSKKFYPDARVSGFSRKNAPSSFNAVSYFIGSTYARTFTDWYGFLAPGVLFIEKYKSLQQGTQYYYNIGLGHTITTLENQYIFSGLIELNGDYSERSRLAGNTVPNTGGNIIYATPSLWLSTPRMVFQIGIALPVSQFWYGNQSDISYYTGALFSWTIH